VDETTRPVRAFPPTPAEDGPSPRRVVGETPTEGDPSPRQPIPREHKSPGALRIASPISPGEGAPPREEVEEARAPFVEEDDEMTDEDAEDWNLVSRAVLSELCQTEWELEDVASGELDAATMEDSSERSDNPRTMKNRRPTSISVQRRMSKVGILDYIRTGQAFPPEEEEPRRRGIEESMDMLQFIRVKREEEKTRQGFNFPPPRKNELDDDCTSTSMPAEKIVYINDEDDYTGKIVNQSGLDGVRMGRRDSTILGWEIGRTMTLDCAVFNVTLDFEDGVDVQEKGFDLGPNSRARTYPELIVRMSVGNQTFQSYSINTLSQYNTRTRQYQTLFKDFTTFTVTNSDAILHISLVMRSQGKKSIPRIIGKRAMQLGKFENKITDQSQIMLLEFSEWLSCVRIQMQFSYTFQASRGLLSALGQPCESIPTRLSTGDICLFSSRNLLSAGTKFITRSKWNHVAIVLVMNDEPMLLEVTHPDGVELTPAGKRLSQYWRISDIGVRRLLCTESEKLNKTKFIKFAMMVNGKRYETNAWELVKAVALNDGSKSVKDKRREEVVVKRGCGKCGGTVLEMSECRVCRVLFCAKCRKSSAVKKGGCKTGSAHNFRRAGGILDSMASASMDQYKDSSTSKMNKSTGDSMTRISPLVDRSALAASVDATASTDTKYFCSQLVVESFQQMGLLPLSIRPNTWLPKDFAADVVALQHDATLGPISLFKKASR